MEGRLKKYLTGYFPINLLQAVITLFTLVVFTRVLTPYEYGLYALYTTGILWTQGFFFQWLILGVGRFVESAEHSGELSEFFSTTYILFFSFSLAVVLVSVVLTTQTDKLPWLTVCVSALILRSFAQLRLEMHRNMHRILRFSVLEGFQSFMTIFLGVFLVDIAERPGFAPILGLAIANLLIIIFDFQDIFYQIKKILFKKSFFLDSFHYSAPLALSYLLSLIVANGDRFLISVFMSQTEVGHYSAAYGLADRPISIFFNWVGMATTPLIFAAMQKEGISGALRVMEGNVRIFIFLGFPISAGLAAIANPLSKVLMGPEFQEETAVLLPWLAIGGLLNGFMAHYLAHIFLATKRTSALFWTSAITAIANILLNLILIPKFGLIGAAWATIFSYALGVFLRTWEARVPIPMPMDDVLKGIFSCVLMVGVVRVLAFSGNAVGVFFSILTGIFVYSVSALSFNLVGVREKSLIWLKK
ncbi:Oligosaccharide flippase family protein [Gammaproteobacteria bacterium]